MQLRLPLVGPDYKSQRDTDTRQSTDSHRNNEDTHYSDHRDDTLPGSAPKNTTRIAASPTDRNASADAMTIVRDIPMVTLITTQTATRTTGPTYRPTATFFLHLQSSYTRNVEAEADDYSLSQMERLNIDPIHFATAMQKLSTQFESNPEDEEKREYLSSHPSSASRIEKAKARSESFNQR